MISKWTTALRYQAYENWPKTQITEIKTQIKKSHWRLGYHIQPTTGLLNDPNGFSYFNHAWHLFYQSFPFGPVHGLKSWVELTSTDLVHWQNHGTKLYPNDAQDRQGAFSGSAIPVDDQLFIMYTGNVRDQDWVRHPKQNGAWLNQSDDLTKLPTPLIDNPPVGYTEHFRDPQIIEHNDQYYALFGAQREDQTGHVLVYQANSVLGPWSYLTELKFSDKPLGYMVECPNLVFIDNQPVLIFCPQGISQTAFEHQNIYPNAYVVGKDFDWQTFSFIAPSAIQNLDAGFDVYATQAFNAPDGRALAVSWIGLPDTSYPSDQENWANCLSLVKELRLVNGQLIQQPAQENTVLQQEQQSLANVDQQFRFETTIPADTTAQMTIITTLKDQGIKLTIDTNNGELTVDRSQAGIQFATDFGESRTINLPKHQPITINGYVDHSVFEFYLNNGEKTLTGRFFGNRDSFKIQTNDPVKINAWKLATVNQN